MALPKNLPVRLELADFGRNRYFEMTAPGVTLEDVMSGDYWVHVRKALRVNDILETVAADGAFDAELRILSVNQASGAMVFRVLRNIKGAVGAVAKSSGADRFTIKHDKFGKYQIIERKTGRVVVDGLDKASTEAEKARLEEERQTA